MTLVVVSRAVKADLLEVMVGIVVEVELRMLVEDGQVVMGVEGKQEIVEYEVLI